MNYRDYSEYIREYFPGVKVQKLSVNAGFTCPNRDGTIGRGGCIYCDNRSFTPAYCAEGDDTVTAQLERGKAFFARKYPAMKYLAYFQSYTNTYGRAAEGLGRLWEEALAVPDVVGLVVGTRPDMLGPEVVEALGAVAARVPVFLEIGAETSHDRTLAFINRGHTWQTTTDAARRCAAAGLHVGLHLIAGLPGETEEDILATVDACCALPIESLKLHQLQVIRGTTLHRLWIEGKCRLLYDCPEQYLDLCIRIIERVPRHIAIERFLASAPPAMVVAPRWGLKNHEFTDLLKSKIITI